MKPTSISSRLAFTALATGTLSLGAHAGLFKENPAPPSGFLEAPQRMAPDTQRTPFHKAWRNPSPAAWNRVQGFERVVIMPVSTSYLNASPEQRAQGEKLALYMREQFEKEFAKSGKYRVVTKPGPRTLELDLALVQLKPTNVAGNVASTGASAVVPGANFVGGQFTHGNVAFEAKLRNGGTGELLAQYADSQRDKMSFFSIRDYSAYGHSRKAIDDWAKQMEQLATTPRTHKVESAMRLTLNPF